MTQRAQPADEVGAVFMVLHYPEPGLAHQLAAAMFEMGDAMAAMPGCAAVLPPMVSDDESCIVGFASWTSRTAFEQAALPLGDPDQVFAGETRPRQRFVLTPARRPSAPDAAEDFTAVLNLPASADAVAALFTSAAGVSRWWGPTEGDGAVGGILVTSFGDHGANAMRVREAGPSRVVWEAVVPDGARPTGHTQEWLGTTMEFDILPGPSGAELRFRHVGMTPRLACWEDCAAAWTYFMASIEAVATTGTGTPFEG
jgi:hypothetical protein